MRRGTLAAPVNIHLILLLTYSVALAGMGLWVARYVRGAGDFFVAGRRLNAPLIFATFLASNIGAGTMVGATGVAYQEGISAWWWNGAAGDPDGEQERAWWLHGGCGCAWSVVWRRWRSS